MAWNKNVYDCVHQFFCHFGRLQSSSAGRNNENDANFFVAVGQPIKCLFRWQAHYFNDATQGHNGDINCLKMVNPFLDESIDCNNSKCLTISLLNSLTHWGRVTHIFVGNLTNIGSDNGLSPGRCQSIIWTNAGKLLIGPLGTNFSGILIEIQTFWLQKIHLKKLSAKSCPFHLGLNLLIVMISYDHFQHRI